jgi:hypothetical protein
MPTVTIPPMADIPPPQPKTMQGPPQYTPSPIPPAAQPPPPPSYSDIPPSAQLPPGAPGYMPPAGYPSLQPGVSIMSQFTGMALWSVILGLLAVGVPIATGLTSGGHYVYFYVIPIFGFIRGIQAVTRGQVIGGVVGIVLNAIGGLISISSILIR